MSHLPLDARAILHYLNELGYRNISATQLKEFLKGMQPQSDINSKCKFKTQQVQQQQLPTTPTTRNTTTRRTTASTIQKGSATNTAAATASAYEVIKRSPSVKVIKCKKPLCNFKFYLDIRDHQLTKRIEEQIKLLGGSQEFFLTSSVTHFITDKQIVPSIAATIKGNNINISNNSNISCPSTPQTPQTPQTPHTPQTPYSLERFTDSTKPNNGVVNKKPIRNSRADAILNRARRQNTVSFSTPSPSHQNRGSAVESTGCATPQKFKDNFVNNDTKTPQPPYIVWQCEIALRFFKKVQHELKDYLDHSNKSNNKSHAIEPISLKGGFVKIESLKRNYRPYYHLFKKPQEWPKVQLIREDGAFRLSPKKEFLAKEVKKVHVVPQALDGGALVDNMTRKSRTKSSQHHHNIRNKDNDLMKSPSNSQKQSNKCKNQTPQHQKDSSEKQCGVCEICKIEYDALTIHLKSKDHEYFAKNSQNFMALDSLIHSSADVSKFLDENRKLEIKTELEEMEVDHEGLVVIEQDPLQNSENENQNEDDGYNAVDEGEFDDGSQKSSSTIKRKSVESKIFSPTLREKSKRSTKGKHSSEKFQKCTLVSTTKAPKNSSSQKQLAALDIKVPITRKKPSSTAAISPPIRAMLPPNSMYKVVETHTEVNCTPPRGKGLTAGINEDSKAVGSPSIIVKFKKVRTTELQLLNGEAENFMFPKKRCDSSELPTDIDRQSTSDRNHHTQSSQPIVTSSSSSEEQDPDEDCDIKSNPSHVAQNGKKAIIKSKRKLSKVCSSSPAKSSLGGDLKQSFPKTPIQPKEQLKTKTKSIKAATTATKRKLVPASENGNPKTNKVATFATVANKIVLPEATRKSSRTATAIVTAATTSTRLLQAAVEAAKTKNKLDTPTKLNMPPPSPLSNALYQMPKKLQIKKELNNDSEEGGEDENDDGNDIPNKKKLKSKKLRCSRKSVVKMEDRMGDRNKKHQNSLSKRKLILGFDVDEYEDDDDDDVTIDGDDDDEKDEDFIVETNKGKPKLLKKSTTNSSVLATETIPPALELYSKGTRSMKKAGQVNLSMREERLARRHGRLITQLQLELQTGSEEEIVNESTKLKASGKKSEKSSCEKTPTKNSAKSSKLEKSSKKCSLKTTPIKQTPFLPSRYFDYTKSERLKAIRYAFERLPTADLWYHVYKRQDTCEEKYFEYFGSTKYRKLPYELGPIPFDFTLPDHKAHKICCNICEYERLKKEGDKAQKMHVRREVQLNLKLEPSASHNNTSSLESPDNNNCTLPNGQDKNQQEDKKNINYDQAQEHSKLNCSSQTVETKSYAHKHKKLHLLQRYRQELEQQELLQRQKLEDQLKNSQNDALLASGASEIKTEDVTQDGLLSRNDRAESTHSNDSSCGSSIHTNCKSKKMRNKLLNKASFLANLELPPRKSPREHASTLALVSCIIKQRQDSLSKPNSEIDEPPTTPRETESKILTMTGEQLSVCQRLEKATPKTPPLSMRISSIESPATNANNSPRTRSQAATPIEELRFTTEISETVKRMRRGRNKYDYSPPFVQRMVGRPSSARGCGRGGSNSVANLFSSENKAKTPMPGSSSLTRQRSHTPNTNLQPHTTGTAITRGRRRRGRQIGYSNVPRSSPNILTSIRKTGSKKGVLEFEVDNIAIEALRKATTEYVKPKLLEWQIDKFLSLANKEYENDLLLLPVNIATPPEDETVYVECAAESVENILQQNFTRENNVAGINTILNTPPPTDYFSSDFDLCDIINDNSDHLQDEGDDVSHLDRRLKKFSIFNTVHLNKYYRKRKNPKTNRTGWPKATKKKAVTRQQLMKDKIYFLQNGNIREERCCEDNTTIRKKLMDNNIAIGDDESTEEQTRESSVITPPDSGNEIGSSGKKPKIINEDEESLLMGEDSQMGRSDDFQQCNGYNDDVGEEEEEGHIVKCERIIEEDEETFADSVEDEYEEQRELKADSDADADIEEADEDEEGNIEENVQPKFLDLNKKLNRKCKKIIPKIIENEDEDSYEPQEKRPRDLQESPIEKIRTNLLNPNSGHTSTPTTPFMRALRRTPQLNGSLGSCKSPSEKAGDNSDIFTVSSDGLDTDMDLSNSHSQLRTTTNICVDEDDHHHYHHQHHHNTSFHNNSNNSSVVTTKKKFDISKYAPTNAATCAAEAATAAVKSLAISQFLKKEVRVTCRRLRAPFRRFRYRR